MESMETPNASESENGFSKDRYSSVKRIWNEFAIEAVLVLVGFLLAFGLTAKIVLAVVITCLRFAIPDFITAWLVLRCDPDRWHGIAVALLFAAIGFARASIFAFAGLIVILCILIPLGGPQGQLAAVGFGTGFLCAYGFLMAVFPFAFAAALIAWKTSKKLEFAAGLTKLRRSRNTDQQAISLDVWKGLKFVGIASAFSLAVILIVPLTVTANLGFANLGFLFAAFTAPIVWLPIFWIITSPQNQDDFR